MRHLKLYKVFESTESQIQDIKDILIELEDVGYNVYVNLTPLTMAGMNKKEELFISIERDKKMNEQEYEIISGCLLRVREYLSNWTSFKNIYKIGNDFLDIFEIIEMPYEEIKFSDFISDTRIQVKFKKK